MVTEDEAMDMYATLADNYAQFAYEGNVPEAAKAISGFIVVGRVLGKDHMQIAIDLTEVMKFIHRENPSFYQQWRQKGERGELI